MTLPLTLSDLRSNRDVKLPAPQRCSRALAARVLIITDGLTLPDADPPNHDPALRNPSLGARSIGDPSLGARSIDDPSLGARSGDDPSIAASQAQMGAGRVLDRLSSVLSAVPPGTVAVQLRNRRLPAALLHDLALSLRALTHRHAAPLLINDRLDVALSVGADAVHLPGHGIAPHTVRRFVGDALQICAAAHSLTEARLLAQAGVDAVTFSPIWPTPSKPALPDGQVGVAPLGIEALAHAASVLPVPVFALGGIDSIDRVAACAAVGARVACLRALLVGSPQDAADRARAFVRATGFPADSASHATPLDLA